jgi:hypothetical protein
MSAVPPGRARDPALAALGDRPRYFDDLAADQLMAMVMALGTELAVTRERLDTVERLLEQRQLLDRSAIDAYRPDTTAKTARANLHQEFLRRFLRPITQARDRLARLR